MRSAASVVPAFDIGLARTRDSQRAVRHILGDRRARCGEYAVAQRNRRDQIGVAADEAIVPDDGLALHIAIIVDNHRAAAKVYTFAHFGIADVGQMADLGTVADGRLFQLDEVADARVIADLTARTDICERPNSRLCADSRFVDLRIVDACACADLRLLQNGVGTNNSARPHLRTRTNQAARQNGRARFNDRVRRDKGAFGCKDLYSRRDVRQIDAQRQILLRLICSHAVHDLDSSRNLAGIHQRVILFCRLCHRVKQRTGFGQHAFQHIRTEQRHMQRFGTCAVSHAANHCIRIPQNRLTARRTIAAQQRHTVSGRQMQRSHVCKILCCQFRHRRRNQQHLFSIIRNANRTQCVRFGCKRRLTHRAEQRRLPEQLVCKRICHPFCRVRKQNRTRKCIHSVISRDTVQENCSYITHRRVPFPSVNGAAYPARRSIIHFSLYYNLFQKSSAN